MIDNWWLKNVKNALKIFVSVNLYEKSQFFMVKNAYKRPNREHK